MVFTQRKEGTCLTRISRMKTFIPVVQDSPGTVSAFAFRATGVVFSRATTTPHESGCVNEKKTPPSSKQVYSHIGTEIAKPTESWI